MLNVGLESLEHTSITQYSLKKVLHVFVQSGTDAVIVAMQKLHDSESIEPKMQKF